MQTEQAGAPTFGALATAYFEYAKPRLRTCERMQWTDRHNLGHLSETDALSLSRDDLLSLRQRLAAAVGNKSANEVIRLISTIYNRTSESGLIADYNPARGIAKQPLDERNRMLEGDNLPKFFKALGSVRNELLRDNFLTCTKLIAGKVAEQIKYGQEKSA